jgi:hypothetical protein
MLLLEKHHEHLLVSELHLCTVELLHEWIPHTFSETIRCTGLGSPPFLFCKKEQFWFLNNMHTTTCPRTLQATTYFWPLLLFFDR